jgi:hypothetical protein
VTVVAAGVTSGSHAQPGGGPDAAPPYVDKCAGEEPSLVQGPDELERCFADWDHHGTPPKVFQPAQLATVTSLVWMQALVEQAVTHIANTEDPAVDLVVLKRALADLEARLRRAAFDANGCRQDLLWCLDRDGDPLDPRELAPKVFPGDRFHVVVLSPDKGDLARITLSTRTLRGPVTLLALPPPTPAGGALERTVLEPVGRLEIVVEQEAHEVEVIVVRAANEAGADSAERIHTLAVEPRKHIVEFGLGLHFLLDRDVSANGDVKFELEPDLAFTISVFPGGRKTGDPVQWHRGAVGAVFGADLTSPVREKRYYLGVDFSPINGLSLDVGLALMPWEYVPSASEVDDVLDGDLEPVRHYRPSFFFGVRATPEVFNSAKAAFDALR